MKSRTILKSALLAVAAINVLAVCGTNAPGAVATWDGGATGVGPAWSTAANWVGDVLPASGDDLLFNSVTGGGLIVSPMTVSASRTVGSIIFDTNLPAALDIRTNTGSTTTARTLTFNGSGGMLIDMTSNATGSVTFSNLNVNGTASTLSIVLAGSGAINVGSATGSLVLNQNISETGGARSINKTGAGTLTLAGNNSYTGSTTLTGGILSMGSANAIGTTGTISFGGGTLQYSAGNATDYSARFDTGANQAYRLDTNNRNVTVATSLGSSGGSLTKLGRGVLTLTAANSYTGTTTIGGGALQFTNQSTFYNGVQSNWTDANLIVGSGGMAVFNVGGGGEFSLAEFLTLSTLGTGSGGFLNGSSIGIDTTNGGDQIISTVIADTNSGANSLGLAKFGICKLELTAANTYTGATTLVGGTLALSGGDNRLPTTTTLAFNPVNYTTTATLDMGSTNQTMAGITFPTDVLNQPPTAMTLNIAGTGTLTLNGAAGLSIGAGGTDAMDNVSAHHHVLNMTGLNNFVYNNNAQTVQFGLTGSRATKQTNVATVNFATNNTITAASLQFANNGGGGGGGKTTAILGQTNAWNVGSIIAGLTRSDLDIHFATGLVNPTITLRGTDGTSALPFVQIGEHNDNGARTWDDVVDFSGGITDAVITLMEIGVAEPSSATRDGTVNGTFILGAGNVTVTDLKLGIFRPSSAGLGTDTTMAGNGTFTLNNAAGTLNATTITIGDVPVAAGGSGTESTTGTLNVLDGLVKATTITRGAQAGGVNTTARVDFTGGTIQNTDGADLAINDVNVRLMVDTGTRTFNATGTNLITTNAGTLISGVGSMVKAGPGTMILGGTGTFTGTTTVTGGVIKLANSLALAGSTLVTTGTEFDSSVVSNAFTLGGISGSFNLPLLNNAGSPAGIALSVGNNNFDTSYSGSLSGTGASLNKVGTGTLILSGANTYTGTTTVSGGTLHFANHISLYNDVQSNWIDTNLIVESGATAAFSVGSGAGEFTLAEFLNFATFGTASTGFKNGSNIGIDTTSGNQTISTVLANPNGGANAMGLVKLGSNTLFLNNTNTYTGTTRIANGTLTAGAAGAISNAPLIFGYVPTATTTTGNLDMGTFDLTVPSLTVSTNSATANTITIGNGNTLTVTGGTNTSNVVVGVTSASANTTTNLAVTGAGGTLTVNDATHNIVVAPQFASTTLVPTSTLDLSGLGTFNATIANLYVGRATSSAGAALAINNTGTLRLAHTANTIAASGNIVVGAQSQDSAFSGQLSLGTSNDIGATQWIVAGGRASGTVSFDTGLTNPTVSIHGTSGATSRTNITLGDERNVLGASNGAGGSSQALGTMDFTGGTVTAYIGSLNVGFGASAASSTRGQGNGVFTFGGAGSLVDVNSLIIGSTQNDSTATTATPVGLASTGTVTVNGGALVVNTAMTIANDLDTSNTTNSTQNVVGTFNLNGGTATVNANTVMGAHITSGNPGNAMASLHINGGTYTSNGDIVKGNLGNGSITAIVNVNGGTLDMTNHNLGVNAVNQNLTAVYYTGGAINNAPQINSNYFFVGNSSGAVTYTGTSSTVVTLGVAGQEDATAPELYVGFGAAPFYAGAPVVTNGQYDLNSGTLTVNGWTNIGRDGGTGVFNNSSTFITTRELRVGAKYDGTVGASSGTFNNIGSATVQAGDIIVAAGGFFVESTGVYNQLGAGTTTVTGAVVIGDHGVGSFNLGGGTLTAGGALIAGNWNNGNSTFAQGTYTQTGGSASFGGDIIVCWDAGTKGVLNLSGAGSTLHTNTAMFVGLDGTDGTLNMSDGTLTIGSFTSIGRSTGSSGISNISGGSLTVAADYNVGDFGTGVLNLTGGSVTSGDFIVAWQAPSQNSVANINGASATVTATGVNGIYVGRNGQGTMNVINGSVSTTNAAGDMRIGREVAGNGTLNQSGGTVTIADHSYVGMRGVGKFNMSGGTYSAGDNVYVGFEATANGELTQTSGTITVVGNQPNNTGNVYVGYNGIGVLNMNGGLLDMVVTDVVDAFNTLNSASYSIVTVPGDLSLAQDGNLSVGALAGTGTVNQTAGTINVAANVFLGGTTGGIGTMTISGGTMNVGVTSPSGGDVAIGGLGGASSGTLNLQGGTLNVTNGTGKIGAGLGVAAFNFTGGTLKVKEYNAADFGGTLGGLVQSGATSVLDVTGNNTAVNGSYSLADGTALVAKQLTVNGDANLSSGGEFQWQLGALSTSNAGVDFGQIALSGNLVLGGTSKLELDFGLLGADHPNSSNAFWDANHSWKIVDTTTNLGSTNFASLINAMFSNGNFTTAIGTGADLGDIFLNFTASATPHAGDFDSDGDVDGADFVAWQTNFPTAMGATLADGDADGDGDVDGADFVVWQTNFPFTPGPGASPVPEPSALLLAAVSAVGLAALRRRMRR